MLSKNKAIIANLGAVSLKLKRFIGSNRIGPTYLKHTKHVYQVPSRKPKTESMICIAIDGRTDMTILTWLLMLIQNIYVYMYMYCSLWDRRCLFWLLRTFRQKSKDHEFIFSSSFYELSFPNSHYPFFCESHCIKFKYCIVFSSLEKSKLVLGRSL